MNDKTADTWYTSNSNALVRTQTSIRPIKHSDLYEMQCVSETRCEELWTAWFTSS